VWPDGTTSAQRAPVASCIACPAGSPRHPAGRRVRWRKACPGWAVIPPTGSNDPAGRRSGKGARSYGREFPAPTHHWTPVHGAGAPAPRPAWRAGPRYRLARRSDGGPRLLLCGEAGGDRHHAARRWPPGPGGSSALLAPLPGIAAGTGRCRRDDPRHQRCSAHTGSVARGSVPRLADRCVGTAVAEAHDVSDLVAVPVWLTSSKVVIARFVTKDSVRSYLRRPSVLSGMETGSGDRSVPEGGARR